MSLTLTFWGTRGSIPTPGPSTVRYGGNTACVEVQTESALIVLDAGTGIRPLGVRLRDYSGRIDLMLSHLHLDHLQGIGFFEPCFRPDVELHIWGPASTTADLGERLARYLSPPLTRLTPAHCALYSRANSDPENAKACRSR